MRTPAWVRDGIRKRFETLSPFMDERERRLWAAAEAAHLGFGGVKAVAEATGMGRSTVAAGVKELAAAGGVPTAAGARIDESVGRRRVRREGGGRKQVTVKQPGITKALEELVNPVTRGDPQSPLRWTTKSTPHLAAALRSRGFRVSHQTVGRLLHELGYSLQSARKTLEGASHPDRDAQFEHINDQAIALARRGQPVISVDAKKKELVGEFKNAGREWQPKGQPEKVNVHDFPDDGLGKAIPYGVYDFFRNEGWVSVGVDHDTADFAVASIRSWWVHIGQPAYPNARELLITADCGGSNGYRLRLWKVALQRFADETGMALHVCHLPPGTSKWNKIEHRLFCHITQNWRGRPLVSYEVVVNTIKSTTTSTGLRVSAELDQGTYPTGIKVADDQLAQVNLQRAEFHGEWNYTIRPRPGTAA